MLAIEIQAKFDGRKRDDRLKLVYDWVKQGALDLPGFREAISLVDRADDLSSVKVGDKVEVEVLSETTSYGPGFVTLEVMEVDEVSFRLADDWWFYLDGEAYTGNARAMRRVTC